MLLQAGQDAKRARPSPEARMPCPAAAIGQAPVPTTSDGAGPSAPAAAAAVGEDGGAAQPLNVVSALSDAAPTCAICQVGGSRGQDCGGAGLVCLRAAAVPTTAAIGPSAFPPTLPRLSSCRRCRW